MILEDICEFIVDCPHSTAPDEGFGYPIIRTPNVGRGRLILEGVQRVSKEVYDKRNARAIPQTDDIIFAREAPAGNAAIIKKGQQVCLGQRTVLIRPNRRKVYPQFLVYYLLAPKQQYELLGTANGATVAHVNIPVIKKMPVKLPTMKTQIKMANMISVYDDLIENNKRQVKLLEEAAQRLYKEWFVDWRFPGYEKTEIVDDVPKGWGNDRLDIVGKFKRGKTITKANTVEGDVAVVAGGLEPAYYHNVSNTDAPVITISGSGANAGFVRMYYKKVWASDCSYIDRNNTKHIYYLYCLLKNNKRAIDNLQKGAAQPHVYAKDINTMKVLIAQEELIDYFEKVVEPIFTKIKNCSEVIEKAIQARDRLLPRLMNGEMEV